MRILLECTPNAQHWPKVAQLAERSFRQENILVEYPLSRRAFKNVAMGKRFPETNLPRRPSQFAAWLQNGLLPRFQIESHSYCKTRNLG
jgi:hypothetical protein